MTQTKDKILDSAERLFGLRGFDATSLRSITSEAGVNLAAVNYHFQSKDALIHAVLARRLGPINQRRLELLDACEKADPLCLDAVLRAFILPLLEQAHTRTEHLAPLMGRMYTEPAGFFERVIRDHLRIVLERFSAAFRRALPGLPETALFWRLHFLIGAIAHTLAGASALRFISDGRCDARDFEEAARQMTAFVRAGLLAPVPGAN